MATASVRAWFSVTGKFPRKVHGFAKYAVDANLFRLESSILTRAKRFLFSNRNLARWDWSINPITWYDLVPNIAVLMVLVSDFLLRQFLRYSTHKIQFSKNYFGIFTVWINFMLTRLGRLLRKFNYFQFIKVAIYCFWFQNYDFHSCWDIGTGPGARRAVSKLPEIKCFLKVQSTFLCA